jgi:NADPH:quinone reductase-like Zn-dependent oxidoreductase
MKAIVQHEYGAPQDVLHLADVEMPAAGAQDVLVSVRASSANPWDWHFIRGEPVLLRPALGGVCKPKFPVAGGDVAGTVERAGSAVTAFGPGDEVYGFGHGAFAEYVAVDQGSLAPKPGNLTFEQAAAVPMAAVTALQGLRAGGIQPGQHVLIIGASGGVGTFAVQIAAHLGAQVTGVCSTPHADLVRRLGAGAVVDYAKQDFTAGADRYDLAFQLGGTYSPAAVRKVLTSRGTLIQSFGDGGRWFGPVASTLRPWPLTCWSARP